MDIWTLNFIGLILNFTGTIFIWCDSANLSRYINPNEIILGGSKARRSFFWRHCLRLGLLLLGSGFLFQLYALWCSPR